MAERKEVVWTESALNEKLDILHYWIQHNKSATFSIKLNNEFDDAIDFICQHEKCGIEIKEQVFRYLVREYQILYEITERYIVILSIWDGRQDPQKLKQRLE